MEKTSNALVSEIVDNLIHTQPLLSKGFTRSIRSRTNLNPGTIYIVGLLKKHQLLTMSEIGCKLSMPKPHVTAQVDKLIAEKMVERVYDEKDRRIIKIKLTEKGIEDFEAIKRDLTTDFQERINKVNVELLETLADATKIVRQLLTEVMTDNASDTSNCPKTK